jgi:hypothetical protein
LHWFFGSIKTPSLSWSTQKVYLRCRRGIAAEWRVFILHLLILE